MAGTSTNRLVKIQVAVSCILLFIYSCSPAKNISVTKLLQQSYDLRPEYRVGAKDFYRITTVYLDMDDYGRVSHRAVLEGDFSREIVSMQKEGHTEFFEWMCVKKGEQEGQGEITEYTALPYSKGFQYTFSEWTREHFPVDLSSIPKSMEGWKFVVKLIDAHTFDVLANLNNYEGHLTQVGDSALLPASAIPVSMNFPPLFTDTYFTNADLTITFLGIALFQGEPCAILVFRSEKNGLHMVTNMNGMKFPSDGTSYYWGEIFLSLEDKKIVRGKIFERVDMVTSLATLGAPVKHVTRREIILERMQPEDFKQIVP
jgi:hypothetical protein